MTRRIQPQHAATKYQQNQHQQQVSHTQSSRLGVLGLILLFIAVVLTFSNDVIWSSLRQFWGPPLKPTTRMVLALLSTVVEVAIFIYANKDNLPAPQPPDIGWG